MLSIVVLISGAGTNFQALHRAVAASGRDIAIVAVGADRPAEGLEYARAEGLATFTVPFRDYDDREQWGDALLEHIRRHEPDLVILSGFMRLLPPAVVRALAPGLINTHPAYLPEFPGAHAVRDALAAGAEQTGASVIVVDEGVDSGPLIHRQRVPVLPGDDEASLHERIKVVERELLARTVFDIADRTLALEELST